MRSDAEWAREITRAHDARRTLIAPAGADAIPPGRAYAIQALVTDVRLTRGERVVGWKLGYTSEAMRRQMGVESPNVGPLTDAMLLRSGSALPETVTQPRVEPEVALVVGDDPAEVRAAHVAIEVVDSVWADYAFTWADNTADGSSAAYVVLGPEVPVEDVASLPVTLTIDGALVAQGVGSAAMGDPLAALAWLRLQLEGHPRGLQPGDVVITGGLTAAVPLPRGSTVVADFAGAVVQLTRMS